MMWCRGEVSYHTWADFVHYVLGLGNFAFFSFFSFVYKPESIEKSLI